MISDFRMNSIADHHSEIGNFQSAICDSSAIDDERWKIELIEARRGRQLDQWFVQESRHDLRLARTLLGVSPAPDDDVTAARQ